LVEEVRLDAAAARFAGAFLAALRALEADFTAPRLALRAAVFLADERAEDFTAVFLATVFLAAAFLAVVFLAADLATVFLAAFLAVVFLAEAFTAVFLAVVFFAAVFLAPALAEDFTADLEADFAATFFVAVFLAAVFLAPDLAEDFAVFLPLDELRRALLFFADFLVPLAPVSPVNNWVSGLDLTSVGIAASFKGLAFNRHACKATSLYQASSD
jgi:hypothetical protein